MFNGLKTLFQKRRELRPRPAGTAVFLCIVTALLILLLVPISGNSLYPCFVDSARTQKIAVLLGSPIRDVTVREGSVVQAGDALFRFDASRLRSDLIKRELQRRVLEIQIQLILLDEKEMARAPEKQGELTQLEYEIALLKRDLHIAEVGIVAPFSGVVASLDYRVQNGYQPGKGVVVGNLKSNRECVVRVLVPEEDLHKVSQGQEVEIWLPARDGTTYSGRIEKIKPYSEEDLKDNPFSSRFGGEIATDTRDGGRSDAPLRAHYVCTAKLSTDEPPILGVTGRCAVAAPPRSILRRLLRSGAAILNRETML